MPSSRSLFVWTTLVLTTVSCAADATIHLRAVTASNATTTNTTPTSSPSPDPLCPYSTTKVLDSSVYDLCLSSAFPSEPRTTFVFTTRNQVRVYQSVYCTATLDVLIESLFKGNCLLTPDAPTSIRIDDLKQLQAACNASSSTVTTRPRYTVPPPTDEKESEDYTFLFIGIGAGAVFFLLCVLGAFRTKNGNETECLGCLVRCCCYYR